MSNPSVGLHWEFILNWWGQPLSTEDVCGAMHGAVLWRLVAKLHDSFLNP